MKTITVPMVKTVVDNNGQRKEIITGLKAGDVLVCHKTQRSTTGIGLWSSEKYDSFEEGKEYTVDHTFNWDYGIMVAYVRDEDGCLTWATPETFKLKQ